jgi:hypothetical protein
MRVKSFDVRNGCQSFLGGEYTGIIQLCKVLVCFLVKKKLNVDHLLLYLKLGISTFDYYLSNWMIKRIRCFNNCFLVRETTALTAYPAPAAWKVRTQ